MNNADKEDGKSIEAGSPPIFPPTLLPTDEDVARELVDHICKAGIWGITGAAAIIARHTAGLRARVEELEKQLATAHGDTALLKVISKNWRESAELLETSRDSLRAEVERLTKKGQADAHDFSVAMNKRHEINWAEISSLRAALNASEERVKELQTMNDTQSAMVSSYRIDLTDARAKIAALQNELLNAKDTK